ncbi:MAG: cyclic nucleotide-binding domain-containing protein [Pyrinomonadaceae bacterium]
MAAYELRKKAGYFLAFAILIGGALVLFPTLSEWVRASLSSKYNVIVAADGLVTLPNGEPAPSSMTTTALRLTVTLLRLFLVVLWMALVVAFVRFLGVLVTRTVYRNTSEREISSLLKTVLSIIVYIVAFFIIFQSIFENVQLAPLFTGSTILGIVVGLALQDTLGNLFAGLALQADQPFQVGDVILIPGRGEGVVESVSWRGVKMRTFQNKLLVISNSVLGKETIEVAPKDNLNARAVFFNSQYSHSPAKTIQVVRDAVRQVENVSQKIRPVVRIRNLGPDGIDWEVKYWLDDYTRQHDTDALIRQRIWYVFQREKLQFAYPTRTWQRAPKPVEIPPETIINTNAERLSRVTIFAPLSEDEIQQLANVSKARIYAPGEMIVRAGKEGSSMFVIIRGSIKVQVTENNYQKTVGILKENDFFGEMSLLTGEPRSATVVAEEETEVLQIKKSGLQPILENNPELIDAISERIEERRELLKTVATDEPEEKDVTQKGVMQSIKKFFGMNRR